MVPSLGWDVSQIEYITCRPRCVDGFICLNKDVATVEGKWNNLLQCEIFAGSLDIHILLILALV